MCVAAGGPKIDAIQPFGTPTLSGKSESVTLLPSTVRTEIRSGGQVVSCREKALGLSEASEIRRHLEEARTLPKDASYCLSPFVNEGSSRSERLSIEFNGETWGFRLVEGSGPPPIPGALQGILADVGKNRQ